MGWEELRRTAVAAIFGSNTQSTNEDRPLAYRRGELDLGDELRIGRGIRTGRQGNSSRTAPEFRCTRDGKFLTFNLTLLLFVTHIKTQCTCCPPSSLPTRTCKDACCAHSPLHFKTKNGPSLWLSLQSSRICELRVVAPRVLVFASKLSPIYRLAFSYTHRRTPDTSHFRSRFGRGCFVPASVGTSAL